VKISSNVLNININQSSSPIKTNFTEKISKDDVAEIKAQISENSKAMMFNSTSVQSTLSEDDNRVQANVDDFQSFLDDIGYEGKAISELSQDEARDLVSEDGFFGIDQTSDRMAEFVINGSNGDEEMMRAGRDGIVQGYNDAQDMWGGELPEISQKTMDAALEKVDKAMADLGYSILNEKV